jgi:hypothetical protein
MRCIAVFDLPYDAPCLERLNPLSIMQEAHAADMLSNAKSSESLVALRDYIAESVQAHQWRFSEDQIYWHYNGGSKSSKFKQDENLPKG